MENLYTILGVGETASLDEIKKAYKRQAVIYHPDKNLGDIRAEERFKAINNAYQILSNAQKRAQYDLLINYQQFQQTTTYTDYNNQYSRTYKHTSYEERRQRAANYAASYTAERKKVARESMTIGSILIVSLIVIVGIYAFVESYIANKKQEETNALIAARVTIIESYYDKEDFRAAFEEADLLISGWPIHPATRGLRERLMASLNYKAEKAYSSAEYDKALEYYLVLQDFDKFLEKDFDFKIAKCFTEQGMHDNAIDKLKKIIENNPNDLQAWCEIGKVLYTGKKDYAEAIKYIDFAKNLAISFYEQRYGKAYPMLLEPNSLSKVHFEIFYQRALIQKELNNLKEAINDCSWASFLNPKSGEIDFLRAQCEYMYGNTSEACSYITKAKQKAYVIENEAAFTYCQ